jgi:hypothetical protein
LAITIILLDKKAYVDFMLITMMYSDEKVNIDLLYNFDFIIQNVLLFRFQLIIVLKCPINNPLIKTTNSSLSG